MLGPRSPWSRPRPSTPSRYAVHDPLHPYPANPSRQPFLALSKSATSPRAAIDLIRQATSAPNTFIFAELLQTPAIRSLANSSDAQHRSHHALLRIFSHGTYAEYISGRSNGDGLPDLTDAQMLKLRQLTLLSLVRDRSNLTYSALQERLGLSSDREVESLVVTAIYAGLIVATLDPAREAVQVTGVAPLRDLAPDAVARMGVALTAWSDRCTSTLQDIDAQIAAIRAGARAREGACRKADERFAAAKAELADAPGMGPGADASYFMGGPASSRRDIAMARKLGFKRGQHGPQDMDLDDPMLAEGRGNKRKM